MSTSLDPLKWFSVEPIKFWAYFDKNLFLGDGWIPIAYPCIAYLEVDLLAVLGFLS